MSVENDIIDQIIMKFREDGRILNLVNPTNIGKGLLEGFPTNLANNAFPNIRITWPGTREENEPGDDKPPRRRIISLGLHIATNQIKEDKRLEDLTKLCEVVENVLYDIEESLVGLILDEINLNRIETTEDSFAPHAVARMDVEILTWTTRDARAGL